MDARTDSFIKTYMAMLESPWMVWFTIISILSIIAVTIIAYMKGLKTWEWFIYAFLLGPVALIHILFKHSKKHDPNEPDRQPL